MVAFVLVPSIRAMEAGARAAYISAVFPRVFRLASLLAGLALISGLALNYLITGWRELGLYFGSPRGAAILAGALLGGLLAGFHFFVEGRIEGRVIRLVESDDEAEQARIERLLLIVPRGGLVVLTAIFVLMMFGAG